jgi:hypothetical protein
MKHAPGEVPTLGVVQSFLREDLALTMWLGVFAASARRWRRVTLQLKTAMRQISLIPVNAEIQG